MKLATGPINAFEFDPRRIFGWLRACGSNRSGSVLTTFALLTPLLGGATGAAVDYGMYQRDRVRLQTRVDAAAVASARELSMAKADSARVSAVAENYVRMSDQIATVTTQINMDTLSVTVQASKRFAPLMGQLFWGSEPTITASATARLNGMMPLCLLALDGKAAGTIHLESAAWMTAPSCMVYSNSRHPSGIQAKDDAVIKAGLICSAGGRVKNGGAKFTPDPATDCPVMEDPLRSRPTPTDTTCRFNEVVISGGSQTLQPGVYCKGLKITNGAEVTFARGTYVIKDGPFVVDGGGIIKGTEVGFYLTGRTANLVFDVKSSIYISAPKDGAMAGLLIYDDPSGSSAPSVPPYPLPIPLVGQVVGAVGGLVGGLLGGVTETLNLETSPREHKILSDDARLLLGTIYMPQGRLIIDATKPIADKSAYTVLVVRQLDLHAGPNLYLNSDYSASDVPVPKGVGPYGSKVMLTN